MNLERSGFGRDMSSIIDDILQVGLITRTVSVDNPESMSKGKYDVAFELREESGP
jgi:hypothetical protein